MARVIIIGCGGAGKSTLARTLGPILRLPVIHLDRIHWQPGWREPSKEQWAKTLEEAVARPAWIIDGNYGGLGDQRAQLADTIIWLDLPRWRCLMGVIKRRIQYHRQTRPDMGPGCPERLEPEFLRWIWTYRRKTRPKTLDQLAALSAEKRVIRLESPGAVRRFVADLRASHS